MEHRKSTEQACWQMGEFCSETSEDVLTLTGKKKQTVRGFGGCFNEMGYDALLRLPEEKQEEIFSELFGEENCNFTLGRVPIGANDFSLEWYSCDEVEDDYKLEHFTIDRDKRYTIPYIKRAMKYQPDLELFASPWSPPIWMKTKRAYNFGRLRKEEKILNTYADYYIRFVEEYRKEQIKVNQIHVQNEPMADQKFPSCLWSGEEMRDFIRDYLGPKVKAYGNELELWVGTINGPFVDFSMGVQGAPFSEYYDQFENTILSDKETRSYITGLGFQWGGKHSIAETVLSYPELRYMQTESECGDGANTWEHAEYIYRLMWHYFYNRAESYMYWNMVLPEGGVSTWGWSQNSLFTVGEDLTLTYQPEFYMMKHFSHYVKKGAVVLETQGHWASNVVAFENPDHTLVLVVGNNMNHDRIFSFSSGEKSFSAKIEAHSIHTFCL